MPNDPNTGRYYRINDPTVYRTAQGVTAEGDRYNYLAFTDLYHHPVWMKISSLACESAAWLRVAPSPLDQEIARKAVEAGDYDALERLLGGKLHMGVDQGCELIAGLARWMGDGNLLADETGSLGPHGGEIAVALETIQELAAFVRDNTRWGTEPDDGPFRDPDERITRVVGGVEIEGPRWAVEHAELLTAPPVNDDAQHQQLTDQQLDTVRQELAGQHPNAEVTVFADGSALIIPRERKNDGE